jgi:hypothetical protein
LPHADHHGASWNPCEDNLLQKNVDVYLHFLQIIYFKRCRCVSSFFADNQLQQKLKQVCNECGTDVGGRPATMVLLQVAVVMVITSSSRVPDKYLPSDQFNKESLVTADYADGLRGLSSLRVLTNITDYPNFTTVAHELPCIGTLEGGGLAECFYTRLASLSWLCILVMGTFKWRSKWWTPPHVLILIATVNAAIACLFFSITNVTALFTACVGLIILLANWHFRVPLCAAMSLVYWCSALWIGCSMSGLGGCGLIEVAVAMRRSMLLFPEGKGDAGLLENLGLDTDEQSIRQALEVFLGGTDSLLEDFQEHLKQQSVFGSTTVGKIRSWQRRVIEDKVLGFFKGRQGEAELVNAMTYICFPGNKPTIYASTVLNHAVCRALLGSYVGVSYHGRLTYRIPCRSFRLVCRRSTSSCPPGGSPRSSHSSTRAPSRSPQCSPSHSLLTLPCQCRTPTLSTASLSSPSRMCTKQRAPMTSMALSHLPTTPLSVLPLDVRRVSFLALSVTLNCRAASPRLA